CYGEDPFLTGTMVAAIIRGPEGNDPKYLQAAALLKHFLANSNEDTREASSSDFDEALFREYYSVPFRMGFVDGGARCFMAAYNQWNHVPCTVHPAMREVVMGEWGVDGMISTDRKASPDLVLVQHYYSNAWQAASAEIHAGINQFHDDEFAN